MADERIEVAICVEQLVAILDAAGCDQCIDRLAHGNSTCPQLPEVGRPKDGDVSTSDADSFEWRQQASGQEEITIVPEALQHFDEHEIANDYPVAYSGAGAIGT